MPMLAAPSASNANPVSPDQFMANLMGSVSATNAVPSDVPTNSILTANQQPRTLDEAMMIIEQQKEIIAALQAQVGAQTT